MWFSSYKMSVTALLVIPLPFLYLPSLLTFCHRHTLFDMKLVILLIGLAASSCAAELEDIHLRQSNWTVGQTVQTSSGPVSGHPAKNDSQVSEYLGIPFGQAPIGDLRFAAPVKFNGTAPLNGTIFVNLEPPRNSSRQS